MTRNKTHDDETLKNPVALFYLLEASRRDGDFAAAAAAQKRLESLGITVRYGNTRRRRVRE